jgi:hypothetical protein
MWSPQQLGAHGTFTQTMGPGLCQAPGSWTIYSVQAHKQKGYFFFSVSKETGFVLILETEQRGIQGQSQVKGKRSVCVQIIASTLGYQKQNRHLGRLSTPSN